MSAWTYRAAALSAAGLRVLFDLIMQSDSVGEIVQV